MLERSWAPPVHAGLLNNMKYRQLVFLICATCACLLSVGIAGGLSRAIQAKAISSPVQELLPSPPAAMGDSADSSDPSFTPSQDFDLSSLPTGETSRRSPRAYTDDPFGIPAGQQKSPRTTAGFLPATAAPTQPQFNSQPGLQLPPPGPAYEDEAGDFIAPTFGNTSPRSFPNAVPQLGGAPAINKFGGPIVGGPIVGGPIVGDPIEAGQFQPYQLQAVNSCLRFHPSLFTRSRRRWCTPLLRCFTATVARAAASRL